MSTRRRHGDNGVPASGNDTETTIEGDAMSEQPTRTRGVTAERDALAERRVVHYSGTLPNAPIRNARPDGFDDASWHEAASADTGTSYVPMTRVSVVACEWCEHVFIAETAAKALAMFREHEEERARTAFEAAAPERAAADARREARRAEREAQR